MLLSFTEISWTSHHSSTNKSTPLFLMATAFPPVWIYHVFSSRIGFWMTCWWFFVCFAVANETTMKAAPFFKGSNLCTRFSYKAKGLCPGSQEIIFGVGRWYCLSPWSCPEASYYECVTLTSLGKSLLHLFTLPTWRGCYQASPPSVSALESQMVEGLLGWLVGLPGTLGSGWACSA